MKITVSGTDSSDEDDLQELFTQLAEEPELAYPRLVTAPPAPNELGAEVTAVEVELMVTALSAATTVVVAWLRYRAPRFRLHVKDTDGSRVREVTVEAVHLTKMDPTTLRHVIEGSHSHQDPPINE